MNKSFLSVNLIDDNIETMMNKMANIRRHMGFITMFKKGIILSPDLIESTEYELVDGQQRLLTITLLLKMLSEKFSEYSNDPDCVSVTKELKENFFEGLNRDGSKYYRMTVNDMSKEFYNVIMTNDLRSGYDAIKAAIRIEGDFKMLSCCSFFHLKLEEKRRALQALSKENTMFNAENVFKNYMKTLKWFITRNLRFFICFLEKQSDATIMYESLNNRGLPLNELDKLKNYLIYISNTFTIPSLKLRVIQLWGRIYTELRRINLVVKRDNMKLENELLTLYYTTRKSQLKKQEITDRSIFYFIKREFYSLEREVISKVKTTNDLKVFSENIICDELEHCLDLYCELYLPIFSNARKYDISLRDKLIKRVKNIILISEKRNPFDWNFCNLFVSIWIYSKRNSGDNSETSEEERLNVLKSQTKSLLDAMKLIESVLFRVYFITENTKSKLVGVKQIKESAAAIYNNSTTPETSQIIQKEFKRISEKIRAKNGNDALEKFLGSKTRDFTQWKGLRYFFYTYENDLRSKQSPPSPSLLYESFRIRTTFSKETSHIIGRVLPRNWSSIDNEDYSSFGFGSSSTYNAFSHLGIQSMNYPDNLGNLIIIEKDHDEDPNQSFIAKQDSETYKRSDVLMQRDVDGLTRWTPDEIEKRCKKYIAYCKKKWRMMGDGNEIGDGDGEEDEDVDMLDDEVPMIPNMMKLSSFGVTNGLGNNVRREEQIHIEEIRVSNVPPIPSEPITTTNKKVVVEDEDGDVEMEDKKKIEGEEVTEQEESKKKDEKKKKDDIEIIDDGEEEEEEEDDEDEDEDEDEDISILGKRKIDEVEKPEQPEPPKKIQKK